MTFPNFLAPWWGLLGLLAIPIVLLYLLRQKRPEVAVSSTFLWAKALADMRASTPFQKLRRHLLLWLQLLILGVVVLALMRPVVQAAASPSSVGVIVIDAGASMQTRDGGGPTRLERAKGEAKKLVESMRPGDQFAVLVGGEELKVRDAGKADRTSGFLSSKADLTAAIDGIAATDVASDLSDQLLVAADSLRHLGKNKGGERGGGRGTGGETAGKIWLFSDGVSVVLPNVAGMSDLLKFVRMGESSSNVGIVRVAVSAVPKEAGAYQVFVGLFNASGEARSVVVGLAYGEPDHFIATTRAEVPAGGTGSALFEKVKGGPGKIYLQLDGKDDDLALDNTAYGVLEAPRKVRLVLVTRGNKLLENFVKTAAKVGEVEGTILEPGAYSGKYAADFVIFDKVVPAELPTCDCLFLRPPAGVGGFRVTGAMERPAVLRVRRDDPVLAYVDLDDLRISGAARVERDPETRELVGAGDGVLLGSRDVGASRRYFLAFDPLKESNWWMQPSLLIFLENLIDQARVRHFIGSPQLLATGGVARLSDLEETATVATPTGAVVDLKPRDGGTEFAATDHAGFYDVRSGEKKTTFAVNLLSPTASNIRPRTLELAGGGKVEEEASVARVNKEIWTWFALGALAVLMVEWFVYHRRIA